jgi:hypothetical protein
VAATHRSSATRTWVGVIPRWRRLIKARGPGLGVRAKGTARDGVGLGGGARNGRVLHGHGWLEGMTSGP